MTSNPNTGTLTVRVPGYPEPIVFADWTHDKLYHTVQINAAVSLEIQAFIGGRGQAIPGGTRSLTDVDTNIPRSGDSGLSEGWEALIYSLQIQPVREWATTATNPTLGDSATSVSRPVHTGGADAAYTAEGTLFDFLRKTYVKFQVNQKVQTEGPADKYPQGSGIHVFGTTTDLEVASNGMPSPKDAAAFVIPVWLKPNISFVCLLRPSAAYGTWTAAWSGLTGTVAVGIDVRVSLAGLIKRPVT